MASSRDGPSPSPPKRTCLCSPTNHPGSFRCSYHKQSRSNRHHRDPSMAAKNDQLKETKAILLQMIKPPTHDHHKRKNFQAKPSRFCLNDDTNRDALAVS